MSANDCWFVIRGELAEWRVAYGNAEPTATDSPSDHVRRLWNRSRERFRTRAEALTCAHEHIRSGKDAEYGVVEVDLSPNRWSDLNLRANEGRLPGAIRAPGGSDARPTRTRGARHMKPAHLPETRSRHAPHQSGTLAPERFRYDVALTFAGSERALAEKLAVAVRQAGFDVFYDDFYPTQLWGKNLVEFFDAIYRKDSRYCVMFISSEYAERMWTTLERQSAQARALEERGNDYILPIRVQPVVLPGMPPTIGYVDIDRYSIEQIAQLLIQKLTSSEAVANGHQAEVPARVALFEILGGEEPSTQDVARRWLASSGDPVAPIGRTSRGDFLCDLRRDGPHALVAGTTGAGKSELLQTLLVSLAVHVPPDRLRFLLVNYKGGAAFRECIALPHTLGVLTDLLDNSTSRQALESLKVELKRRVRMSDAFRTNNHGLATPRSPGPPARLMILVDEFGTLAREVPGFLDGLVDVAERGRGLGIHLILAAQRPAGIVTTRIRANATLRIALRLNDAADSYDVIGDPAATNISRDAPGRALARIGSDSLTEFQTAYAGAAASSGVQASQLQRVVDVVRRAAAAVDIPHDPPVWESPSRVGT